MKIKLFYLLAYTLADISFSMFFRTDTIIVQAGFSVAKYVLYLMLLDCLDFRNSALKVFQVFISWYWIGAGLTYIINMFIHTNLDDYLSNFNDPWVLVPVFTFSILGGVIHTSMILK